MLSFILLCVQTVSEDLVNLLMMSGCVQVCVPLNHLEAAVPEDVSEVQKTPARLDPPGCERVPKVMKTDVL